MSGRDYDRRQVAGRLAAAALLPFAALGAPLSGLAAASPRRPAPAGRFALQRVLTRELGDGAAIVVTRRWRIGFAPAGPGMQVAGEQTFADVAAPPALSPLAALEKARSTAAMFPIALDPIGNIAGSQQGMDAAHLLRAIEIGQALVEAGPGGKALAVDSRAFMAQLARMSAEAVSKMPRDLFFPAPTHTSATREVALPGGDIGTIAVDTEASVDPVNGLLRSSERVIVTRIGTGARTSREAWSLSQSL